MCACIFYRYVCVCVFDLNSFEGERVSFDCFQIKMLVTYVAWYMWDCGCHSTYSTGSLLILARTIWHHSSNSYVHTPYSILNTIPCMQTHTQNNNNKKRKFPSKINGPKQIWWFGIFYTLQLKSSERKGLPPFSFASIDFIVFAYIWSAIHLLFYWIGWQAFSVNRFPFTNFQCQ